MTKEQKDHLSSIKKGVGHTKETKQILRQHNLGNKHNEKTLDKLSKISKNRWKSPEYRENKYNSCKSVSFIDIETREKVVCVNIFEAEKITPFTHRTIREKIKGRRPNNKYKFKYEHN